jgi:hypothetical protein
MSHVPNGQAGAGVPEKPIVESVEIAEAPVTPTPFLDKQGVWLAWGAFGALSVSTLAIILILVFAQPDGGLQAAALEDLKGCLHRAANVAPCATAEIDEYKALLGDPAVETFREFWKGMLERISTGIFFPILTGLLGYLFGTRSRGTSED